jgi:hypothetical protein
MTDEECEEAAREPDAKQSRLENVVMQYRLKNGENQ